MNLCDQCETVSHCTKNGCVPLQACVASGQVSAAQVAAHQEAGELPVMPEPKLYPAGTYPDGVLTYSADQMREYAQAHAAQYKAAHAAELEAVLKDRVALASALEAERENVKALFGRISDAWASYQRCGEVCLFENQPMICASVLEEIHDACLAATQEQKP